MGKGKSKALKKQQKDQDQVKQKKEEIKKEQVENHVQKNQPSQMKVDQQFVNATVQAIQAASKGEVAILTVQQNPFIVVHINTFNKLAKQPIQFQQDELGIYHNIFGQLMAKEYKLDDEQFMKVDSWTFPFSQATMNQFPINTMTWDDKEVTYTSKEHLIEEAKKFIEDQPFVKEKHPFFKKNQIVNEGKNDFQKAHSSDETLITLFEKKFAQLRRCLSIAEGTVQSSLDSLRVQFEIASDKETQDNAVKSFELFLKENPDAEVA